MHSATPWLSKFTASNTPIRSLKRSSGGPRCPPVSALQLRLGQHQKVEEPLCFPAILTESPKLGRVASVVCWCLLFFLGAQPSPPTQPFAPRPKAAVKLPICGQSKHRSSWKGCRFANVANPENWKTFGRNIGKFWNIWTYSIWKAGICPKAGCSNLM